MRVITVAGDTLFAVALQNLGDGTQWIRIAALNNISDTWLSGLVVIRLPTINPMAGGGIAIQ